MLGFFLVGRSFLVCVGCGLGFFWVFLVGFFGFGFWLYGLFGFCDFNSILGCRNPAGSGSSESVGLLFCYTELSLGLREKHHLRVEVCSVSESQEKPWSHREQRIFLVKM